MPEGSGGGGCGETLGETETEIQRQGRRILRDTEGGILRNSQSQRNEVLSDTEILMRCLERHRDMQSDTKRDER